MASVHPSPWGWIFPWAELAAVAVLSAAYVGAARRDGTSRPRVVAFAAGVILALGVLVSPAATLAQNYLLSAHLFQNVALAEWAPGLAVLGLSPAMARALAALRAIRALTHPLVALALWLGTYAVWHVPVVYDAALRHPGTLLAVEHASYFLAGALLWWPVLHDVPHRLPSGARAAYVFGAFLFASPLGLLLALLPDPLYPFYVHAPRLWNVSPLTDQQIAGLIMAGTESVVFFAVFAVYFARFLAEEDAGYSPRDA